MKPKFAAVYIIMRFFFCFCFFVLFFFLFCFFVGVCVHARVRARVCMCVLFVCDFRCTYVVFISTTKTLYNNAYLLITRFHKNEFSRERTGTVLVNRLYPRHTELVLTTFQKLLPNVFKLCSN